MPTETPPSLRADLPSWVWIGLPVGVLVLPYAARACSQDFFERWVRTERGIVENATALALAVAVVAAASVVQHGARLPRRWLVAWFALFALGCTYFLGEEVSWGQHYFGWETPAALAERNEQGETNLHNLGGWTEFVLDQGPRALLTAAALLGGVLAPLFLGRRRAAGEARGEPLAWLLPDATCLPSAALALLANLPKHLFRWLGADLPSVLDVRGGESKECLLALFLMVYALAARRRLIGSSALSPAAARAAGVFPDPAARRPE